MKYLFKLFILIGFASDMFATELEYDIKAAFPEKFSGVSCPMLQLMHEELLYAKGVSIEYMQRYYKGELTREESINFIKDISLSAHAQEFYRDFIPVEVHLPEGNFDGIGFVTFQSGYIMMHKINMGTLPDVKASWDIDKGTLHLNVNLFDVCITRKIPIRLFDKCKEPDLAYSKLKESDKVFAKETPALIASQCEIETKAFIDLEPSRTVTKWGDIKWKE